MKLINVPIKIDPSFFVLIIILASSRAAEPALLAEWVIVVFISIIIHELGHATAARNFGLSPSILLYSMGGQTSCPQAEKLSPLHNLIIGLAGPLAGFLLGGLVFLSRPLFMGTGASLVLAQAYFDLLWVNIGWGLFNLLPMAPLDGGNFLHALESWFSKKTDHLITHSVSFALALGITCWAFYIGSPWIAFLGIWFAYTNGNPLIQKLQKKQDQKLQPTLNQVREMIMKEDFSAALVLIKGLQKSAKTTPTKGEIARLLIFTHTQAGNFEKAETELKHFNILFGDDPYLEGVLLLKKGLFAQAVKPLKTVFNALPSKESGMPLYHALIKSNDFDEALKLASNSAMNEVAWDLQIYLANEAFNHGAFKIAARAGQLAFEHQPDPDVAYNVACAYAQDYDATSGFKWLESAIDSGFTNRELFLSDPDLNSLRTFPEYERLKVKLDEKIG